MKKKTSSIFHYSFHYKTIDLELYLWGQRK